jgi:hypothetical protein
VTRLPKAKKERKTNQKNGKARTRHINKPKDEQDTKTNPNTKTNQKRTNQ